MPDENWKKLRPAQRLAFLHHSLMGKSHSCACCSRLDTAAVPIDESLFENPGPALTNHLKMVEKHLSKAGGNELEAEKSIRSSYLVVGTRPHQTRESHADVAEGSDG
jgi:hypothetical protein